MEAIHTPFNGGQRAGTTVPERVYRVAEARAQYGSLVDRLIPWLHVKDPLADAVIADFGHDLSRYWGLFEGALNAGLHRAGRGLPPSVHELLASVEEPPFWVDYDRMDRAGRLLFRTGPVGGIVLGARSLVYGYASPAGNKPLILSGRLTQQAPKRLSETSRFVYEVCKPGGMRRFGEGFKITLRVRLMHARVRWLIEQGDSWDAPRWGDPINQHDMLATSMLFSQVWLDGVRKFGFHFSEQEAEDWLHLWNWCSIVMGVAPELLPFNERDARDIESFIRFTQQPPDHNSRLLVQRLMDSAEQQGGRLANLGWGFLHGLIEPRLAEGLGAPKTRFRWVVPSVRQCIRPIDRLARRSRRVEARLCALGEQHWMDAIESGLPADHQSFRPAKRLLGRL